MTASQGKKRLLLIVSLLIIMVGAILFYIQLVAKKHTRGRASPSIEQVSEKKTPAYKYTEPVNPDTEPNSSIPGWKVYTSLALGYSIDHPKNWKIYPGETKTQTETITTLRESRTFNEVEELTKQNIKVDLGWVWEGILEEEQRLLDWVQKKATEETKFVDPGTNAIVTEVAIGPEIRVREELIDPQNKDKDVVYYYASKGQRVFFFMAYPANSNLLPTLEKILKTFRFVTIE